MTQFLNPQTTEVRTIFFWYHCTEGCVHLLMDQRLVHMTVQDVNIKVVLLN